MSQSTNESTVRTRSSLFIGCSNSSDTRTLAISDAFTQPCFPSSEFCSMTFYFTVVFILEVRGWGAAAGCSPLCWAPNSPALCSWTGMPFCSSPGVTFLLGCWLQLGAFFQQLLFAQLCFPPVASRELQSTSLRICFFQLCIPPDFVSWLSLHS